MMKIPTLLVFQQQQKKNELIKNYKEMLRIAEQQLWR